MDPDAIVEQLRSYKAFFDRSSACLTEEDAAFAPAAGMRTVAQSVAHVAQTVDWFLEGAFRPQGFELDFGRLEREAAAVASLADARAWLDRAFANAEVVARAHSAQEWAAPLPAGPIMGGAPRFAIVGGINDHTAHHRGALAVYARLRGREPAMPYA